MISLVHAHEQYRKIPKINSGLIVGSKLTVFALFYFALEGNFLSTSFKGSYICKGDLTEGFVALPVFFEEEWGGGAFSQTT